MDKLFFQIQRNQRKKSLPTIFQGPIAAQGSFPCIDFPPEIADQGILLFWLYDSEKERKKERNHVYTLKNTCTP